MKVLAAIACLIVAACSTTRPPSAGEHSVAPLSATTADGAIRALRDERAALGGIRALLRVRVTTGEETQSFKAAIDLHGEHMELTAFTPLGTTAMAVTADGDRVHVHDAMRNQEWDGTAADLSRLIGIFPPGVAPAGMGWLLLGYPGTANVTATPAGLASATAGELTIRYDPPGHPPQHIEITGPKQQVDVTLLEVLAR